MNTSHYLQPAQSATEVAGDDVALGLNRPFTAHYSPSFQMRYVSLTAHSTQPISRASNTCVLRDPVQHQLAHLLDSGYTVWAPRVAQIMMTLKHNNKSPCQWPTAYT
jgi:hypothetical protein